MKNLLLITLITLSLTGMGQGITLAPADGDRFSYFLDGDVWNTDLSYCKSVPKFVIHVFVSPEGRQHVWFDNFYLKEWQVYQIEEYIDKLSNIAVSGRTFSKKNDDVGESLFSSFNIYYKNNTTQQIESDKAVDLNYLLRKIKEHFKTKTK